MKAAKANCAPAHDMDEDEFIAISRQMRGHKGEGNHLDRGG